MLIGDEAYFLVSEYDQREAAKFAGYTWTMWDSSKVTQHDRVQAIAHYRMHNLVDAHVQHAMNEKMEADARKASHR